MPTCQTSKLWQVCVEVNFTNCYDVEQVEGIMVAVVPAVVCPTHVCLSVLV
jgi:hypothetical protein